VKSITFASSSPNQFGRQSNDSVKRILLLLPRPDPIVRARLHLQGGLLQVVR